MEINTISYIDKVYKNKINLKNNLINTIIDYGNIRYIENNNKKYMILDDILKLFNNDTLGKEIDYYSKKNNIKNEEVEYFIKTFAFQDELNRSIYQMSYSEIKIISIFLNVFFDDKLIILDNPTECLDYKKKKKLLLILKELRKTKTVLIISNDIEFVHKVSDNIIVLNKEVINEGDKYQIFVNTNIEDIPNVIKFSSLVKTTKSVKIGYRDDINDLIKDIYRYVG